MGPLMGTGHPQMLLELGVEKPSCSALLGLLTLAPCTVFRCGSETQLAGEGGTLVLGLTPAFSPAL